MNPRLLLLALIAWPVTAEEFRSVPAEPMTIGTTPQFFIDDYVVDNRWAINFDRGSTEMPLREFHAPKKHPKNPLISPPRVEPANGVQPGMAWVNVVRDEKAGMFKMWYAASEPVRGDVARGRNPYHTAIAYAESKDGLKWVLPKIGKFERNGSKENNIVWMGMSDRNAGEAQIVTQIPEEARRGYRYLLVYLAGGGIQLVGSKDGITWDKASNQKIHAMASDFPNNILWDPVRKEFVMYCRAKTRYLVGGNRDGEGHLRQVEDVGESRRVARLGNRDLWTEWKTDPQQILQTDELDAVDGFTAIYAFTAQRYGDIVWGLMHPFRWNNWMHAELAFSRDGFRFDRLPTRPKLIPRGPAGSWDSGMILAAYNWVEVGDEWWLYYNGWDGPHGRSEMEALGRWRTGAVGLSTIRKEGFISIRGPKNGGVVCTRLINWPGGGLFVNCDAKAGELKVRLSDEKRKVLPGFDYKDCEVFNRDATSHEVKWKNASIASLAGRAVRVEFFIKEADLYTFRAGGSTAGAARASE